MTATERFDRAVICTMTANGLLADMDRAHAVDAVKMDTVETELRRALAAVTALNEIAHGRPVPEVTP